MNKKISPFNGTEIYSMSEYWIDEQPYSLKYVRWAHQLFKNDILYSFYLN